MDYRLILPENVTIYADFGFDIEEALFSFRARDKQWFMIEYKNSKGQIKTYEVRPHPAERRENSVCVQSDDRYIMTWYADRFVSVRRLRERS